MAWRQQGAGYPQWGGAQQAQQQWAAGAGGTWAQQQSPQPPQAMQQQQQPRPTVAAAAAGPETYVVFSRTRDAEEVVVRTLVGEYVEARSRGRAFPDGSGPEKAHWDGAPSSASGGRERGLRQGAGQLHSAQREVRERSTPIGVARVSARGACLEPPMPKGHPGVYEWFDVGRYLRAPSRMLYILYVQSTRPCTRTWS